MYRRNAQAVAREVADAAAAAGIKRPKLLWVLQAPMPPPQRDTPRLLNDIYRDAAAASWDGSAGDLLIVPDSRHTLHAIEDSAVLLTVAKHA